MAIMSGGEAVVKSLEEEGARVAFGVLGSHLMPTYDALIESSVKLITPRSEDGAGHMADAYTRISGNPGVVLTTAGPGAAGVACAMGEAYNESWPLLHISTQILSEYVGKNKGFYHDGPNQGEMFVPVSSWQHSVTRIEEIPEAINEAYRRMRTGRPRPVFLDIPTDFLNGETDFKILPKAKVAPPSLRKTEISNAIQLIRNSKRPAIWAGGGVVKAKASTELREIAERLQAPVFCTNGSKGVLPEDHGLALGNLLSMSTTLQEKVLAKSDLLLALGTRFSQRATKQWTLPIPSEIIHCDIDPEEFGRNYAPTATVEGDAKIILHGLINSLDESKIPKAADRTPEIQTLKAAAIEEMKGKHPEIFHAMEEIRRILPRDAIVASQSIMGHWTRFGFQCYQPGQFLFANTFGSMGYAFHAAVGAKVAFPERTVIGFCGDGGFIFGCGELATLQQYNIAMPIVVFNNGGYSIIRQRQDARYNRNIGTRLTNPDYVTLAHAFGFYGEQVHDIGDLAPAIERALQADKTTIIEVPLEFEGYRSAADSHLQVTGSTDTNQWATTFHSSKK